jgi:large subunit ribosomal protein L21
VIVVGCWLLVFCGAPAYGLPPAEAPQTTNDQQPPGILFFLSELTSILPVDCLVRGVLHAAALFLEDVVYAIIRSGGKQYRVAAGDTVTVERDVLGSADQDKVTFNEVLMIGGDQPQVGSPTVQGATVVATVVRETRGDKIIVFRKKRRKNHTKRTHGHRQDVVEIRIDSINV